MPHVVVTLWRQPDDRWFIHVLSQSSWLRRLPYGYEKALLCDMATIPPSGRVTIRLPWEVASVCRPITNGPVSLNVSGGVSTIEIDGVDKHDVLVVE